MGQCNNKNISSVTHATICKCTRVGKNAETSDIFQLKRNLFSSSLILVQTQTSFFAHDKIFQRRLAFAAKTLGMGPNDTRHNDIQP